MSNKKRLYIIVVLLLLFTGIYLVQKDWTGASSDISTSNQTSTDLNISDLMASMNIYHPREPKAAPDFDLRALEGSRIQLSQYRGKVVLLSFWATW